MPAIHNEIDLLTVGGIRNDVRDTFTRSMIATEEVTDYASRDYYAGEYFILKSDRNLYRTKVSITRGTQFTPGVNIEIANIGKALRIVEIQSPLSLMNIVGNYEPTGKATKKYVAGDRVILQTGQVAPDGGVLYTMYRVTTTINQGVAFANGTNVVMESQTLSTVISNLQTDKMDTPVVLTQILQAGQTNLTFTHDKLNDNSRIDIYTNQFGVDPIGVTTTYTSGRYYLGVKFKAQTVNVDVKVVISN